MPVGYQGEAFSYSDRAAGELFPNRQRIGFENFVDAFAALTAGDVGRLVLPIENSTTGSVLPVLDRLVAGGAKIVAEHYVEVRHAVLGVPGATLDGVVSIRSHAEALSQAGDAIARRGWQPVPVSDTAGAVRMIAERGDPTRAALAPPEAAGPHGLEILLSDVVDKLHNTTRFVVLEAGDPEIPADADKSSVAFETLHRPGALALALTELGLRGANLTRIESRPTETPWTYRFFVNLVHQPGPEGFTAVFDPHPVTMAEIHHLGTYRSEVS
ncbi:MAG: prephenate dehydratase domain-containing protein [Acidimicrobiia bacterium]|nr:prephenate dehydratase domain-containing protein [Acidimicrobiia bacterium]